jgi:hypothetical protein
MKYLILSTHRGVPIDDIVSNGNNQFTISLSVCSPLDDCIVYDDDNGNNRVGHGVQVLWAHVDMEGTMRIEVILTPETVVIDFHPTLDDENQKQDQT